MNDSLKIAICGATGYVGIELVKILLKHKKVKIIYLCAQKSVGQKISKFDKSLSKKKLPLITKINKINFNNIDLIFSALPNGYAQLLAQKIPDNLKLIDLSGDFRFKKSSNYKKWYKKHHKSKNLINKSIYAISEFSKNSLKNYKIISCPGCYPTSVQLPLIPLIKKKLIKLDNIIIDSKSGYSGAGKNLQKKFKFKNLYNSVSSYSVRFHKHVGEIDQELTKIAKKNVKVTFIPHLIPMFRGILSTMYLEVNKNSSPEKIYNFLKKYHKKNVFVKFAKFNNPIGTGKVMNSNSCQISVCQNRQKNKVIIFSAIDNLLKGAAGQAIQNMNLKYNFKEDEGLNFNPVSP